jgi:glycosyltransferase involved in cell wall biosynthesis
MSKAERPGGAVRISHFVQRYPPALGGSEAYFARLCRHLAADGDAVTVFTSTALDIEAFWGWRGRTVPAGVSVEDGVTVRRYGLLRWPGRRWFLKPLNLLPHRFWQCLTLPCNPVAPRMWTECGRPLDPFDAVHATAFPYAFPIACGLRLSRRLGVPFLLTPFLHLGDPADPTDRTRRAYLSPPLRFLLAAADRVFVQTDGERAALLDLGLPAERVVLQGLGVDADECTGGDRERARRAWGVEPADVVVGCLANQSVEKGGVDLLRAAELLWRAGRSPTVVLAGPEMPNFRRFWNDFGPKERVRRLGVVTEAEKRDFFAGIDVFALPSRSDSFGLVLLEAWANGVPNLAYRAGGVAGVVRDGEDGLLVRCGDVVELAAALGRLAEDGDLRRRFGAAGRARLGRDYVWADKLALVQRVVREVVAEKSLTPSVRAGGCQ